MRPREIACAIIIDTRGRFLLQQRDDVPGIIHLGKVGVLVDTERAMRLSCNAWCEKFARS
jgi:hypothetical protein